MVTRIGKEKSLYNIEGVSLVSYIYTFASTQTTWMMIIQAIVTKSSIRLHISDTRLMLLELSCVSKVLAITLDGYGEWNVEK